MGLFSRNQEALETTRASDAFETQKRSPRSSRTPRSALDGNPDAPPALDPAETAKTRARHRLIGAVVLATAAVVFVPMLFDRAPIAPPDEMSLQIPERDTPFEGRKGVPDAARGPLKSADLPTQPAPAQPASAPTPAPAETPKVEAPPAPKPESAPVARTDEAPQPVVETPAPKVEPKATTVPEARTVAKAPPPAKTIPEKPATTPTDDPKALAALEGKPAEAPAKAAGSHYAVQVAAYAQMSMAKSMQDKLTANGLKAYTQSTTAANGNAVIRVRLGPYASLDEADRAKQKLKAMKLDGSVVPL